MKVEMQSYQKGIDYEKGRIIEILNKYILNFKSSRAYWQVIDKINEYKLKFKEQDMVKECNEHDKDCEGCEICLRGDMKDEVKE